MSPDLLFASGTATSLSPSSLVVSPSSSAYNFPSSSATLRKHPSSRCSFLSSHLFSLARMARKVFLPTYRTADVYACEFIGSFCWVLGFCLFLHLFPSPHASGSNGIAVDNMATNRAGAFVWWGAPSGDGKTRRLHNVSFNQQSQDERDSVPQKRGSEGTFRARLDHLGGIDVKQNKLDQGGRVKERFEAPELWTDNSTSGHSPEQQVLDGTSNPRSIGGDSTGSSRNGNKSTGSDSDVENDNNMVDSVVEKATSSGSAESSTSSSLLFLSSSTTSSPQHLYLPPSVLLLGLLFSVLLYLFSSTSGAHFNPAVTYTFWLTSSISDFLSKDTTASVMVSAFFPNPHTSDPSRYCKDILPAADPTYYSPSSSSEFNPTTVPLSQSLDLLDVNLPASISPSTSASPHFVSSCHSTLSRVPSSPPPPSHFDAIRTALYIFFQYFGALSGAFAAIRCGLPSPPLPPCQPRHPLLSLCTETIASSLLFLVLLSLSHHRRRHSLFSGSAVRNLYGLAGGLGFLFVASSVWLLCGSLPLLSPSLTSSLLWMKALGGGVEGADGGAQWKGLGWWLLVLPYWLGPYCGATVAGVVYSILPSTVSMFSLKRWVSSGVTKPFFFPSQHSFTQEAVRSCTDQNRISCHRLPSLLTCRLFLRPSCSSA
eukprot:GHVS01021871.1.p1 GENE.GHVS01021871.1~~GHVS01021871.1.p1  ORF type:complete len:668 (-),score=106.38 GHVS01021871.1:772-2733(-)